MANLIGFPQYRPARQAIGGNVGAWRSLVAHLHGVQGVGGSNPLAPTRILPTTRMIRLRITDTRLFGPVRDASLCRKNSNDCAGAADNQFQPVFVSLKY